MDNEKTFKTKTGFCHILPDRIVLSRDGLIGNISSVTIGNTISRIFIIYGLLSVGLFYFSYNYYFSGEIFLAILFALPVIYLIYGIINSLNNSAAPIIDRNTIKIVKFKKGIAGLTRSRFEIMFEDENRKIKKRIIMLPGTLTNGQDETEKALQMLKEEKLLTNHK